MSNKSNYQSLLLHVSRIFLSDSLASWIRLISEKPKSIYWPRNHVLLWYCTHTYVNVVFTKPSTKPYVEPLETNPDPLTLFLYETLVMHYQVLINLQKSSFVKLESKLITSNIQIK